MFDLRARRKRTSASPEAELTCEEVAPSLSELAGGGPVQDLTVKRHVEGCSRCQAELAEHRALLRLLRSVRSELVEPAPTLLGDILGALEESAEKHAIRALLDGKRLAYIGGIAVATAAGVGGAIVLSRRKRMRLAA
ncbi:MAG: hypothetical protein KatS3mg008_1134 [Acidimicrobiales bacterium]|nr:MAG: hypothetical protein KatS3mg008_1134 [Acidimicrobiales bacterium]